jgi:hypothetical protein
MNKQTNLISVPTFTFNQGDLFIDTETERPISIDFYNGCITLRQDGEYDQQEQILIHPKFFEALFKAIRKNLPITTELLKYK